MEKQILSLLGGFLFLILINLCGFNHQPTQVGEQVCAQRTKFIPQTMHAKYVDDMAAVESINLKKMLVKNPSRPLPDPYHCRTGHSLPPCKSKIYSLLEDVQEYAIDNQMKLNFGKTKFMLFNPCRKYDFQPEFDHQGLSVDCVEQMKLLGVTLRSDLRWCSNTEDITKRAYARLWAVRRLVKCGASKEDMVDIYTKQVRSVLEFGVPVWNAALKKKQINDIERVQRTFTYIVFDGKNISYPDALLQLKLDTLEERRVNLCRNFAVRAAKHNKYQNWFKLSPNTEPNQASPPSLYQTPVARLGRFRDSPIPYLTKLLNETPCEDWQSPT